MSSINLPYLRELLERRAGLDLGRGGMAATLAHFVKQRLSASELKFERYLEQLEVPGSEELRLLLEAMTVVYTWFFRDPGQFAVLEQLIQRFPSERTMGIWVAGCATGEEPYSVALVAARLDKRVDILATDLNSEALRHAQAGRYSSASLAPVDATMRARYLGNAPDDFIVPDAVRQAVRFKLGNLVEPAPRASSPEGWDLVICRNVLIYFGQEQARHALNTLASSLAPGGYLVLGASEAILERPAALALVGVGGRAVLQRPRGLDGHPSATRVVTAAAVPLPPKNQATRPLSVTTSGPLAESGTLAPLVGTNNGKETTMRSALALPRERAIEKPFVAAETSESALKVPSNNAKRPATVRVALEQGHTALEAGNVPVARENYELAVQLDATCAEASMFAGIAHYLDGDLEDALRHLRGALCLDHTLWAACFYQALCYENMGCAEDAARSYSLVLRLASEQSQNADSHPFLRGWRSDLLAVARKRAHSGRFNRTPVGQWRNVRSVG
jgi:chemotaxis protein methyltransferase CheR